MAQRCDICGKGPQFGNRVSHAHNVTHRRFNPNLKWVRAVVGKGTHKGSGLHALPALRQGRQARSAEPRPQRLPRARAALPQLKTPR